MEEDERAALHDEFKQIANLLWNYDGNASIIDKDFGIDLDGRTRYSENRDAAEDPLFSWVSDELMQRKTYSTFMKLMDNYASETGVPEDISEEEIQEQWNFLDAVCETDVMYNLHQWLLGKGLAPVDLDEFKEALNNIWFNMYGRHGLKFIQ